MILLFLLSVVDNYFLGVPFKNYIHHSSHIDRTKELFTCYDNSSVIPLSKLNDHHRDCLDGSDELGTPEGPSDIPFYCENKPYIPIEINRSMVSDGVCDCCDGSDEYFNEKTIQCKNTCEELNKPRYLLLNEIKGIFFNGMTHRRVLLSGGNRLLNRSKEMIERYEQDIKETQDQIDYLLDVEKSAHEPSISERYPLLVRLWEKLFLIDDKVTFGEVFDGIHGRVSNLRHHIENFQNKITNLRTKYSIITEHNLPVQFAPLLNVSFPYKEYDFRFLIEMFKGTTSLGKFSHYDEEHQIIFLDHGDICSETNEPFRTDVYLECWFEGMVFDVTEASPGYYKVQVGTQEVCDFPDIVRITQLTYDQLKEFARKHNYKPKFN